MKKTSVYLSDEEVEGLREAARLSGRSQSELIRDAVRHIVASTSVEGRQFHSMGVGHGPPYEPWDADELYKKVMGLE